MYYIKLQAVMMSPLREKGVSKQGYLTKAPFHGESNGTPGAKVKYASCHLSIPFSNIIGAHVEGEYSHT